MICVRVLTCLSVTLALATGQNGPRFKKEIAQHDGFNDIDYNFPGFHKFHHHLGYYNHHFHAPPAISTVSYFSSQHSKPVTYSGFTNHGRGHHDPGYAIDFSPKEYHGNTAPKYYHFPAHY